jgi:pyridoxamine 5'-phosphate oxidase
MTNMATVDLGGKPSNRMVVLRRVSIEERTLTVFSDSAASKCASLKANPATAFCFWEASTGIQVRMTGQSKLVTGQAVRTDWANVRPQEQGRYRIEPTPGSKIPDANAYALDGETRFTRIDCVIDDVDILCLDQAQHTRLHASFNEGEWVLDWWTP